MKTNRFQFLQRRLWRISWEWLWQRNRQRWARQIPIVSASWKTVRPWRYPYSRQLQQSNCKRLRWKRQAELKEGFRWPHRNLKKVTYGHRWCSECWAEVRKIYLRQVRRPWMDTWKWPLRRRSTLGHIGLMKNFGLCSPNPVDSGNHRQSYGMCTCQLLLDQPKWKCLKVIQNSNYPVTIGIESTLTRTETRTSATLPAEIWASGK